MKNNKISQNDFGKKVLERIKKDKVKQISRKFFIVKNIVIWLLLFISIFIGALALSITFNYLVNADWSLLSRLGILNIIIIFMPMFWVFFLILSSLLAYFDFKNTENGYKFSFIKIFFINIVFSILIGLILYLTGFNLYIEGKIERNIPQYRNIFVEKQINRMIKVWQNEKKGLIIGKIAKVSNNGFSFIDYNNKEWNILLDFNNKTIVRHRVNISVGEKIKIIGKIKDKNNFIAYEIRPFLGKRFNNN